MSSAESLVTTPTTDAREPGGPEFGELLVAVRRLLDTVAGLDAPDEETRRAATVLDQLSDSLRGFTVTEDDSRAPSCNRHDLPGRGNPVLIPYVEEHFDRTTTRGQVTFTRAHLGGAGATHGGMLPLLFDDLLGHVATRRGGQYPTRTAYLHVDYRNLTPVGVSLSARAWVEQVERRKITVRGEIRAGDQLIAEAHGLFITPETVEALPETA